jgi:hypothetical protein
MWSRMSTRHRSPASPSPLPCRCVDQVVVAGCPQPDVVRKDGGTADVAVPVDGIDPVEQRDAEARVGSCIYEGTDHVCPHRRRARFRVAVTAAQHGSDCVVRDLRRCDAVVRDLGHLTDLLCDRHFCDELVDRPMAVWHCSHSRPGQRKGPTNERGRRSPIGMRRRLLRREGFFNLLLRKKRSAPSCSRATLPGTNARRLIGSLPRQRLALLRTNPG